ncbi:thioesterase [Sulfitobacter sp. M220]|jgi:acyl-CoA thioester hydrolase|uniref:Thioesterase n=2 Tax=root TaxID=1 RepID=A0A7V1BIG7_9RHOB|nr:MULTISPECIES: thioesterase family protein [Sulfitobacter]MBQ0717328.1 thioesterase family protein [Sulfitobacter litoralis]MCF7725488.1 thioesterase [Sulfitobacter sp. M22]MCF7776874.1 thioesterase [Sulfitobacter sp. M220]HDY94752.1 thioesterase [Sulfitobacter litoralis]HDZ53846.1 thioesterase [Sulfitobacter litoralis]|tara:strand:- start:731 stop:1198 length:468 start_codon:yes stop_codon:yes gene_type:complete
MDTPFRSSPRLVQPEWIDFNGHLNMAYYSVLMDNAVDDAYHQIGFGPEYQKTGHTTYVAEFHVCYLRELHEGASTYCTFQLLDFDEKRFHSFTQLWHEDGWLAATGEALTLHIDQSGPRVAPMPADIMARLEAMRSAHATLPYPEQAGRKIGLKR